MRVHPTAVELVRVHRQLDHFQAIFFELNILDLDPLHRGLPLGEFRRPFSHKLWGPP